MYTIMIEIAQRGQNATMVYQTLAELVDCRIFNLVGSRLKLETMSRAPLANHIADMLATPELS